MNRPALSGMILGKGVSIDVSIPSDMLLDMSPAIRRLRWTRSLRR